MLRQLVVSNLAGAVLPFDAMEDSPVIVSQLPIIATRLFNRMSAGFSGLLLLRLLFHIL